MRARRWQVAGLTVVALSLTACGSVVPPSQFVGALNGTGAGNVAGTSGGVASGTASTGGAANGGATGAIGGGATGGGATGGGATGGGATGGGATGSATGGARGPAPSETNCAGFKNGPGITDKEITIATIADVSGAVPNQFKSAHDAVNAYAAYFNSTSTICGRKLVVKTYDSALSASGDHDASKAACSAFALVGSFSAFDSGGADVTQACGQPDIRNTAVTQARQHESVTHAVSSLNTAHVFLEPWVWAKQQKPDAIANSAFVYLNAGASGEISQAFMKGAHDKLGFQWKKTIVVDIASVPNWNAYANQLKSAGITFISTNLGGDTQKLVEAIKQADYHPFLLGDGSTYTPGFIGSGDQAQAVEGTYLFTESGMLEESARNAEMAKYQLWVNRTGGTLDSYGPFSWAAADLFTKLAVQLGGKLSRQTLLDAVTKVHNYTGNGIITPMDPGAKISGKCVTIIQVKNAKFTRVTPYPYTCGPLA